MYRLIAVGVLSALLLEPCAAQTYRPAQRGFLPARSRSAAPVQSPATGRIGIAEKLDVATFNLTPREPISSENIEQVREMAANIVTVVKTLLYSTEGETAANARGRKLWYDSSTLQLTITDYPDNIRTVSDYIRGLPMMGEKKRSEIVYLKHQDPATMQDLIGRATGAQAAGPQAGGGLSVTKTLRTEGELVFRDLRIRVTRINENDATNDNDDSVEMVVRTPTTSEDRTITEFRSEFIEDYEINIIEVRPSGTIGEGSARIEIRYSPQGLGNAPIAPVR